MKLNLFQNITNKFPGFWNEYVESFKNLKTNSILDARFVALDTETTGFNKKVDRILSIGAVSVFQNRINVNESLELYLEQEVFNQESVKIHGLIKNGSQKKISELEAAEKFLKYIKTDTLVAHHANFDIDMINNMLLRLGLGKLKNNVIDTGVLFYKTKHIIYRASMKPFSLDDLSKELNVPKVDRHTANGDALITAIIFLKIISKLNKKNNLKWNYILNK